MDKRDRLMNAVERLLQTDDWSGRQSDILKVVGLLWPAMSGRHRAYLLAHVNQGEVITPDLPFRAWWKQQEFWTAIIRLKGCDLPDKDRRFVLDCAKKSKWANFQPSEKQMGYAMALEARHWVESGDEPVTEDFLPALDEAVDNAELTMEAPT